MNKMLVYSCKKKNAGRLSFTDLSRIAENLSIQVREKKNKYFFDVPANSAIPFKFHFGYLDLRLEQVAIDIETIKTYAIVFHTDLARAFILKETLINASDNKTRTVKNFNTAISEWSDTFSVIEKQTVIPYFIQHAEVGHFVLLDKAIIIRNS